MNKEQTENAKKMWKKLEKTAGGNTKNPKNNKKIREFNIMMANAYKWSHYYKIQNKKIWIEQWQVPQFTSSRRRKKIIYGEIPILISFQNVDDESTILPEIIYFLFDSTNTWCQYINPESFEPMHIRYFLVEFNKKAPAPTYKEFSEDLLHQDEYELFSKYALPKMRKLGLYGHPNGADPKSHIYYLGKTEEEVYNELTSSFDANDTSDDQAESACLIYCLSRHYSSFNKRINGRGKPRYRSSICSFSNSPKLQTNHLYKHHTEFSQFLTLSNVLF